MQCFYVHVCFDSYEIFDFYYMWISPMMLILIFFFYHSTIIMGKEKKSLERFYAIFIELFDIFPTSVLSIFVGDNFEENKCRSSNCVTHSKRDELFLEKIYIFSQTFFIHLSLDISSLLSFFPEFLLSKRFFLRPSLGNTHVQAASTK